MTGRSIAGLERAIRDARERIEQDEKDRGQHAELAAQAEQEKRSVADDAAAFNEAAQKARHHRDEIERLGLLGQRRARELAELKGRLELARYEEARGVLETALAREHEASKAFAAKAVATDKAAAVLVAARDEVDAAHTRARELCPAGVEFELPADADEPEWPDVDRLIETLQAGPRRPLARAAAGIEQARREGEQRVRTHALQAARKPSSTATSSVFGGSAPKSAEPQLRRRRRWCAPCRRTTGNAK